MIHPRLSAKRTNNQPAVGISLRFFDPAIIEMIGSVWDFVWVDLQHSVISNERLSNLVRACDLVGVSTFVRVPLDARAMVESALDLDVAGVIVPMVMNPADAVQAVRASKYPPLGNRSAGGRRIIDRQGANYLTTANDAQWLICQIETPEALQNAAAIADTPGVNGLMLGPDDYALRASAAADGSSAAVLDEARVALDKAAPSLIHLQIGTPADASAACGFRLWSVGSDHTFLREGARRARQGAAGATP